MYRYIGTAGGGGLLVRDVQTIADELSALREELFRLEVRKQEIEQERAALEGAQPSRAMPPALGALCEALEELREEMLTLADRCDVLCEELCEALYLARRTRAS